MKNSTKIAHFYLYALFGVLVSLGLPNQIYIAVIISMNVSAALVTYLDTNTDKFISKVAKYLLLTSVSILNVWALYQSIAFYPPIPIDVLIVTLYFLFYYIITQIVVDPTWMINITAKLLIIFHPKKEEVPSEFDIVDKVIIKRLIKYKKSNREKFELFYQKKSIGKFTTINIEEDNFVVDFDNEVSNEIQLSPDKEYTVKMIMPTDVYSFNCEFSSLSPITMSIPNKLIHVENRDNLREAFRVNDPEHINVSVDINGRKVELSVNDLSTLGASFTTKSAPVIEFIESTNSYLELTIFASGDIINVLAEINNKKDTEDGYIVYGLEFKDTSSSFEKKIQAAIFQEIEQ